ncbi:MAG: hypothetical protein ACK4VO_00835 [Pseudobdellovibrio sp.]
MSHLKNFTKIALLIILIFSAAAKSAEVESSNEFFARSTFYGKSYLYTDSSQTLYSLTSENKIIFNRFVEMKLTPEFIYLDQPRFHESNENYFETKEAFLSFYSQKLTTRLGFFQMKKEGPDIFDPLDYQQPKNYLDLLHPSKLPLQGVSFEYQINSYSSVEATYITKNKTPILPTINSPWYPRDNKIPTQSESASLKVPDNVSYKIKTNETDQGAADHNYILKSKSQTDSFDFVLQIAETLSNTPTITPVLSGTLISVNPIYEVQLTNPIEIDVLWKKTKYYGFGITKPIDRLRLLTKIFFNQSISPDDRINSYNIAVEKQFENLTLIFESSFQSSEARSAATNAASSSGLFSQAVALGLRYAPTDYFSFVLGGFNDFKKGSYYFMINPKISLTSNLFAEIQVDQMGGKKDSLLWYFEHNDSISTKLSYLF